MSTPTASLPRHVIPRWRDLASSGRAGELLFSSGPLPEADASDVDELLFKWKRDRSLSLAGEIISSAFVNGCSEAGLVAAEYIVSHKSEMTSPAVELARSILGHTREPAQLDSSAVASLRAALRANPRNPVGWSELARFHAIIGEDEKAEREMTIALNLAPNSRFILRSAARCFLHLDQNDRAFEILAKSRLAFVDPWIAAAIVSTCSILGKSPRKTHLFRTLAHDLNLEASNRAELLAALGTLDLESGNERKAKSLFANSLSNGNENVVAQGLWAARNHFKLDIDDGLLTRPFAFEANTMHFIKQEKWEDALSQAELWLKDEPFAGRPAVEISFINAVVLKRHEAAIKVLRMALRANKKDVLLANNLVYSLASLNRMDEAIEAFPFEGFEGSTNDQKIYLLATWGMVEFRIGNPEKGRFYYDLAAKVATRNRRYSQRSLVYGFQAREEFRSKFEGWERFRNRAVEELAKFGSPIHRIVERMVADPPAEGGAHVGWSERLMKPHDKLVWIDGEASQSDVPLM